MASSTSQRSEQGSEILPRYPFDARESGHVSVAKLTVCRWRSSPTRSDRFHMLRPVIGKVTHCSKPKEKYYDPQIHHSFRNTICGNCAGRSIQRGSVIARPCCRNLEGQHRKIKV